MARSKSKDNNSSLKNPDFETSTDMVYGESVPLSSDIVTTTELPLWGHEIRTRFNAVFGMLDLLATTSLSAEQRQLLMRTLTNSERLMVLINNVMEIQDPKGKIQLNTGEFDLREVAEGVSEFISMRSEMNRPEIICDIDPIIPESVVGDRERMQRLLLNLIESFSEGAASSICLRADLVEQNNGVSVVRWMLRCQYRDTVAPSDVSEPVPKDDSQLRLQVAHALVKKLGGNLTTSLHGARRSGFDFDTNFGMTSEVTQRRTIPSLMGVHVLIADPNPYSTHAVARLLMAEGATVTQAESGAGVVERISNKGSQCDVILADQRLPNFAEVNLFAEERKGKIPPIVFLARDVHQHDPPNILRQAPYNTRPLKKHRLLSTICATIGRGVVKSKKQSISPERGYHDKYRVLILDDDEDNIVWMRRALEKSGCRVSEARDGEAGLELANHTRFDLIITDIEMPGLDGSGFARRFREEIVPLQGAETPIVAFTAVERSQHEIERWQHAGIAEVVFKPASLEQIKHVIGCWVNPNPVVLVAEDTSDTRLMIERQLSHYPELRVLFASDGGQAVRMFRRQRISAVLMDMLMPEVDGYTAVRLIRTCEGGATVPVIAMTGFSGREERQKCLNAGCNDFLSKPVKKNQLLLTLRRHLESSIASLLPPVQAGESTDSTDAVDSTWVVVDPEIEDLIPTFLANRWQNVREIRDALQKDNVDEVHGIAHKLRGTGGAYGFQQITDYGTEMMDAAKREDLARAAQFVDQMENFLGRVCVKLASGEIVRGADFQ